MWNKDERAGKVTEAKGHLKKAVGTATDNPKLKVEGQMDVVVGKAEAGVGKAVRKVDEAAASAAKALKR